MPTYKSMGPTRIAATNVTTVDCHKQVRTWRLLRAVMELLIPTCNCTFNNNDQQQPTHKVTTSSPPPPPPTSSSRPSSSSSSSRSSRSSSSSSFSSSLSFSSSSSSSSLFLTGTIFGYKKGKVKFCIQSNSNSITPILLLELAVPTTILAREMRGGLLRIALECSPSSTTANSSDTTNTYSLLEMPVWRMYCNGRRVGFAVKRKPSKVDMEVLKKMNNIVVGAGILHGKEIGCNDDDIMYLRGNFERIRGSSNAESFHLIDPDGNINQDLSIFFLRSQDRRY